MNVTFWRDTTGNLNLVLYYEAKGKVFAAKPVKLEFEVLKENDAPATLVIENAMDSTVKNITTALSVLTGSSTKEQILQGALEAKNAHVNDMRALNSGLLNVVNKLITVQQLPPVVNEITSP